MKGTGIVPGCTSEASGERPPDRPRRLSRPAGRRGGGPLLRAGLHGRGRPCRAEAGVVGHTGFRLAHLHDRERHARHRPGRLPAHGGGPGRQAHELHPRRPEGDAARRPGVRLPLRHRLVGRRRPLGGCPAEGRARPRRPREGRGQPALRLRRAPLRGQPHPRAGAAARRDARLRDGPRAHLPAARRPGAARDTPHVRLQGRQVGDAASSCAATCCPATGSATATTRTPGSATRTASECRPRRRPRLPGSGASP